MNTLDCTLRPDGPGRYAGGIGGYRLVVMADFTKGNHWVWWVSGPSLSGRDTVSEGKQPNPELGRLLAEKQAWDWVRHNGRLSAKEKEAVEDRLAELGLRISAL